MPNYAGHLTVAQVVELTGIPKRTIHAAIARGDLPATKIGDGLTNPYLIERADLDAWIAARRPEGQAC